MRERVQNQPARTPSAGCFFRNPSPQQPAGRLIDAAGLKGTMMGKAQVSVQHANFIVNRGGATAADVLRLKRHIQEVVWRRWGVQLQTEVHIVGQTKDIQDA
jgi:UDP-N-acetylenolpyruvoylglucosamine reductase